MLGKRELDLATVRQERTRRFEPNQRRPERSPFHFRDVIGVVQADRDQLRRRDGKIDIELGELSDFTGWLDVDPIWLCQNLDIFATDFPVEEFVARFKSAERVHVRHLGTIATKSRTGFCSAIENALPSARLNQKALEEPPSRLSAR